MEFDIAGFGITTLDYLCIVDKISNYRSQSVISDVRYTGGGCVSTALVTATRLGAKTSLITCLGNDWIGKEILKELKKENINCDNIEFLDNITSTFSFIQVSKRHGKRAISFYPGSGSYLKFTNKTREIIKKSKVLLLDGVLPAEDVKAAKFAQQNNIKVMLDCNMILNGTRELLPHINYLITSESFLYEFFKTKKIKESLKNLYKEFKPEILVTTLGNKGSVALVDQELIKIGTFDVDVKDTTGCGDVYHGAFLFGILKNWNIVNIMKFATAVSSIKCMHYGGRIGIPDFEKTKDFLLNNGVFIEEFK
ncbi:MAG: carbohydrate kinase family protein [Actinobacteria bacterium]|nr:carbohydrate kinase family protein [Actinomycetota bacterium]